MNGARVSGLTTALLAFFVYPSLVAGQLERPREVENLYRQAQYELSRLRRELRGSEREVRERRLEDRWSQSLNRRLRNYLGQISNLDRELGRLFSPEPLPADQVEGPVNELMERLRRIRVAKDRLTELDARRHGEATQPVPGAGSGSISGRVTDTRSGSGVYRISVDLYDASGGWVDWDDTDPTGDYIFSALSEGIYYLRTDDWNNYLDELYDDIPCPAWCDVTTGTPVSVTSGAATTGIDFALDLGGSFLGTVTAADTGTGLSGTWVRVYDSSGNFVDGSNTGTSGDYEIGGLSPGTFFANVIFTDLYLPQLFENLSCPGGFCDPTSGTPIAVAKNTATSGVDFTLHRGGLISGTVTDAASGAPLDRVDVEISDSIGNRAGRAFSNSSGQYSPDNGLETGTYFAVTDPPTPHLGELYDDLPCYDNTCNPTTGTAIAVTAGSTTTGIDFVLDQGGTITGSAEDALSGYPIGDARIEIYGSTGYWSSSTDTDSLGGFRVVGLAPGSYFALADPPHPYLAELFDDLACYDGCDVSGGATIAVSIATTTPGIDFGLDRGGTIAGVVRGATTGDPLGNMEIWIYDSNGSWRAWDATDSQGRYAVNGLLPGNYFAHTVDAPAPYMDELYRDRPCFLGNCDPTTGTAIAATLNTTTSGIDFELPRGGALTGRLTDARTGDAISWRDVDVYDFFGFVASYSTDEFGYYTTGGLPIGTYYLRTSTYSYHDERHQSLSCEGTCDMEPATPVGVMLGLFSEVNFALYRTGQHPDLQIGLESFESNDAIENCGSITVGPDVVVKNWAEISFTAGQTVIIGNFFFVSRHAILTAGTDARLTCQ